MVWDMIWSFITGLIATQLLFLWCIKVKSGEYDNEKFIVNFIVSLIVLALSVGFFCLQFTQYENHNSQNRLIIISVVGNFVGVLIAYIKNYLENKRLKKSGLYLAFDYESDVFDKSLDKLLQITESIDKMENIRDLDDNLLALYELNYTISKKINRFELDLFGKDTAIWRYKISEKIEKFPHSKEFNSYRFELQKLYFDSLPIHFEEKYENYFNNIIANLFKKDDSYKKELLKNFNKAMEILKQTSEKIAYLTKLRSKTLYGQADI